MYIIGLIVQVTPLSEQNFPLCTYVSSMMTVEWNESNMMLESK